MYDKKEFPIFVGTKLKKCMIESERQQIIELIKKEVIPAIGCTEPIAVALCVAKAAETLGNDEEVNIQLSAASKVSVLVSPTSHSIFCKSGNTGVVVSSSSLQADTKRQNTNVINCK